MARKLFRGSRGLGGRRRKGILLAALALLIAVLFNPIANLILAVRLLVAVRALASGSTGAGLAVVQSKVHQQLGGRDLEGLLYQPAAKAPRRAVLLVAGISEKGCYHPRLVALARALADKGFLVLTPDIVEFRRFEVSPQAMEQIAFWYTQMPRLPGGDGLQKIGLAGISFSGTLSLMVAARPDIQDSVAFVLGIGVYQDLLRCSRGWFASSPRSVSDGYYPTRYYGRWILMISALEMLPQTHDRLLLGEALRKLLLQTAVSAPAGLSPEGGRWYRLATMHEDQSDPELVRDIDHYLAKLYLVLSPDAAAAEIRRPVFLAHGSLDDLIPPEESAELRRRLRRAESHLLISPFLTHTHPLERNFTLREKIVAAWEMLEFFCHLARAAR